jgi:hypothetical protein
MTSLTKSANGVYANFCIRIYGFVKWSDKKIQDATVDSKEEILDFIDTMVIHKVYDVVTRDKFYEKRPVIAKQKQPTTKGKVLPKDGDRFHILEPAPVE